MRLTNRWEELMRPETGNEANKQMGGADETRDWE